jgi:hypothetical protein
VKSVPQPASHFNTRSLRSGAFAAIALGLASPVFAQSEATPPVVTDDSTITVTGQKKEKSEIRREARGFTSVMIAPTIGQYSRRQTGICPLVIGIDPSYHKIIYTKIRNVATRIGAKVADSNCKINSFIIFSENTVDSLAYLRRTRPQIFTEVPFLERSSFFKQPAPARWWYRTEVRDTEGRTFSGSIARNSDDSPVIASSNSAESLIFSTIQINLMASVVMIDLKKAEGYPLEAIAAHAAMVSLVQVKPDKDFAAVPSILNIFAPGKSPSEALTDLTRWDYAFAKSLYEIRARQSGAAQKSELAHRIAAKLAQ